MSKKKKEAKETEVVSVEDGGTVEIVTELQDKAKQAYAKLGRSWFEFAALVTRIHDEDAWKEMGFKSFREYCVDEFKNLDYSTVTKFVKVIKNWGSVIEKRLEKDPEALLPSWDTCYTYTNSEEKIPKEEKGKIKKDILEGKVSASEIKSKVKELSEDESEKKSKKELEDIEKDVDGVEGDDDDDDEVYEVTEEELVILIKKHAMAIMDNLPLLREEISEEVSDGVVDLTDYLFNTLAEKIEEFADFIEDFGSEDEE